MEEDGSSDIDIVSDIRSLSPTAKKRRRLCSHCNQLLAKTTYWEHQRLNCGNTKVDSESDSDSDFELDKEFDYVSDMPDFVNEDLGETPQETHSSPDVEGSQRFDSSQGSHSQRLIKYKELYSIYPSTAQSKTVRQVTSIVVCSCYNTLRITSRN